MILTAFTGVALAVAVGLWSGNRTIVGAHECALNLDEAATRVAKGQYWDLGTCPVTQFAYTREGADEVCCPAVDRHGGEEKKFCATPEKALAGAHPLPGRVKKIGTIASEIVAGVLLLITVGAHIAISIAMRGSR